MTVRLFVVLFAPGFFDLSSILEISCYLLASLRTPVTSSYLSLYLHTLRLQVFTQHLLGVLKSKVYKDKEDLHWAIWSPKHRAVAKGSSSNVGAGSLWCTAVRPWRCNEPGVGPPFVHSPLQGAAVLRRRERPTCLASP